MASKATARPKINPRLMAFDEFGIFADAEAGVEAQLEAKAERAGANALPPVEETVQKLARVVKPGFVGPKQVLPHFMKLVLTAQVQGRESQEAISTMRNRGSSRPDSGSDALLDYEDKRLSEIDLLGQETEGEDEEYGGEGDYDLSEYETISDSGSRSRPGTGSSSSSTDVGEHLDYDEDEGQAHARRHRHRRREEGQDEEGNFTQSVQKLDTDIGHQFYIQKKIGRRGGVANTGEILSSPVQRRLSRTAWRQEINNMEPAYRLPALILKKHQWVKKEEPTRMGPGTYDIIYHEVQKAKKNATTRGILNTCSLRFEREKDLWGTPGPGSYGSGWDNWERYVDKAKHPGRVTIFQSGPCDIRGDSANPGGSGLAPSHYKTIGCMDALINKVTSLRGPYDLYTPDRLTIPYGYYKSGRPNPLGPGQYNILKTTKQEWRTGGKQFKGILSPFPRFRNTTGERITLVAPLWPPAGTEKLPGPGHYDPDPAQKQIKQFKYAFCSSAELRPDVETNYDMAPNRYRIDRPVYCPVGGGFKSNFLSKAIDRLDPLKMAVLTERLRAKDIPPEIPKLQDPCCKTQRSPYLDQYQWKTSCETECGKLLC